MEVIFGFHRQGASVSGILRQSLIILCVALLGPTSFRRLETETREDKMKKKKKKKDWVSIWLLAEFYWLAKEWHLEKLYGKHETPVQTAGNGDWHILGSLNSFTGKKQG